MLRKLHIVHEDQHKDLQRFSNRIKALLSGQTNFFDSFSIRYLGPTDGHDVVHLVQLLQDIRDMKGPRLLHISTMKGKGYAPAEKEPTIWEVRSEDRRAHSYDTSNSSAPEVSRCLWGDLSRACRPRRAHCISDSCHAHRLLHDLYDGEVPSSFLRCRHR